jgi:hypothetical protein
VKIFAQVQKCHSGWLKCWVIGNGPIGELESRESWLLSYIEDDAREHAQRGVHVYRDEDDR